MATILDEFPGVAAQSIKDDIECLQELGVKIAKKKIGREVVLVDDSASHQDVKQIRAGLRLLEKELISRFALGVVCGFPDEKRRTQLAELGISTSFGKETKNCPDRATIIQVLTRVTGKLSSGGTAHALGKLIGSLEELWREQNRLICLDSGTTNEMLADLIFQLPLPTPEAHLSRLTVCSNDTEIFHKLGNSKCPVSSIIIGGQKRGRTDTIAGVLAENFLRQSHLHFGVTIVGAATLDLSQMYACSDTQEEASLKAIMFQQSSLRVVCVDNSKLTDKPIRTSFPFMAITDDQVDLLITNCPRSIDSLRSEEASEMDIKRQKEYLKDFPKFVKSILRRGVPVLLAQSDDTVKLEDIFD